jgi:hypothetical protein
MNPSNTVQARNRLVGRILEESKDVLGDIGVRQGGVTTQNFQETKITTTIFLKNKPMFGEVSYREPNLVAQVAPKIANYIFAFNQKQQHLLN